MTTYAVGTEIRPPAVAGAFYPARRERLLQMLISFLEAAKPPRLQGVQALISPHAGYIYSGPIAAYGYRLLMMQEARPRRIYLLGPAHRVWFRGVAAGAYAAFRTPLGDVPVDMAQLERLMTASTRIHALPVAHRDEHCLEVQLPFLQVVYDGDVPPIVPLLFGEVDPGVVAQELAPFVGPDDLIIVSSDLSHYYPYERARALDTAFLQALLEGDVAGVAQGEACGQLPILTLMRLAEARGWQPYLLDYRNSGDTAGDHRQVVGYASVAYTAGGER